MAKYGQPGLRVDVTPSDTEEWSGLQWLRIGGAGDLTIVDAFGNSTTVAVEAGAFEPFTEGKIMDTGTDATGIVAIG